jgi:fumarylacetoacetate (FAA) hydrolase
MRLGTLRDGTRDGALIVVDRAGQRFSRATETARTLQGALDDWARVEPVLRGLAARLEDGTGAAERLDVGQLSAPLPRAYEWIDGSAYLNHIRLVRRARNAAPPPDLETDPLVYQGGSGVLLGPRDPLPLADPAWGLDFEAEIAVVLGDVPAGTTAAEAARYIRLVLVANDVTCRNLVAAELAKGFGFFVSKPATAFSPFAVTLDELGASSFRDGRLFARLRSALNGATVGDVETGPEMWFSFADLIAHVTRSRALVAGTILGSGTVSNQDAARGVSCLVERRMIETIEHGAPRTPYLRAGDVVRIEAFDDLGNSLFGAIEQTVTPSDRQGVR